MENLDLFHKAPEAHSNEELDRRLEPVFELYKDKIVDGRISGVDYSRMQQEVERRFPDISASVFNPYFREYKKIKIDTGYIKEQRKKAMRPARLVMRHAPAPAPATTSVNPKNFISNKNKAAGDDTPDLLNN